MKNENLMKKVMRGILLLTVFAVLALFFFAAIGSGHGTKDYTQGLHITGASSINGEEWQEFDSLSYKSQRNGSLVIKGRVSDELNGEYVIFSVYDLWLKISVGDNVICENSDNKNAIRTNTPGYSVCYVKSSDIKDKELTIEVNNPYPEFLKYNPVGTLFSQAIVGEKDSIYHKNFSENILMIIIGIVIFFFGFFGFGFSGSLLSKKSKNYIAFAIYAITCGIYILSDALARCLVLFVDNPALCLTIDEAWVFIIAITASYYIKSTLELKSSRFIIGLSFYLSIISLGTGIALYIAGVQDVLSSKVLLYPALAIGIIGGIICLIYETFRFRNKKSGMLLVSMIPLLAMGIIEVISNSVGIFPERTPLKIGMLLSIVVQFVLFALSTKKHYSDMLEMEKMQAELIESRVSIMVTQIQPHFLYNSLTSIAMLCQKDPAAAKKAIIEFADYLRANMNSLKEKAPIPFEKELKHLETYLYLEKMRFGDDLNIVYDIKTTDFSIPLLTVQPLVENAVKHGVGMKEDGGTVTISTDEDESSFIITVSDDGVGFDPTVKKNDGRQHVGMENCKNRLKTMCGGEVIITSEIGKGTVSKIIIPKEKKE